MAYKVYLSPSNQPRNICVFGHSEKQHCEELVHKMIPRLQARGIQFKVRPDSGGTTNWIAESNAWGAQLHLPIHTNASSGTARGTRFGFYTGRQDSAKACLLFKNNFVKIYPLPDKVKTCTYPFAEAKNPKCPSVYCEVVFHDNKADALWFHENMDQIAENLVQSIAEQLGVQEMKVNVKLTRQENADFYKVPIGTVITLDMEEYLLGVVPAEVGNAPLEASKAQAIAARSYAFHRVGSLDDTTMSQAYRAPRSIDPRYINAHNGVRQTAGQMLYYGDKVAQTYYSHSNGGKMLACHEVWSQTIPYLITRDDPLTLATGEVKNGHAVGLSQVGAIYAAKQGITHKQILDFYYPGTVIVNAGAIPPPITPPAPPTEEKPLYEAIVITKNPNSLNVWTTIKSGSKGLVPRGARVRVFEEVNANWARIKYGNLSGYVDRQYLKKETPFVEYEATVNTFYFLSLNIWKDTNKRGTYGKVPRGTKVTVLEEVNATWAKIRYGSIIGYSDRRYLKKA